MIDVTAINFHEAIGNAHIELALDYAFHVNTVGYQLVFRCYLPGELDFPGSQGTAASGTAGPAQVEAYQLPHRIQPQATRHHRITNKVAVKKTTAPV